MLIDYMEDYGLDTKNIDKFEKYKELILEYNKHTNLTRITEDEEFNVKHFLDSLSLFKTDLFVKDKKIIDIGTGAGFPGLPLKLYNEDLDITLLDSLRKRIDFLNGVIEELGLKKIRAIHARAEEIARDPNYRESYDIAVSRAVANLSTLTEYAMAFVKVGGYFISQKGPEYKEELKSAKRAIELMGGEVKDVIHTPLPNDIDHYIIVIKKVKATDKKYPRGGGKPRKAPL
ncbi:16S rRNA (guanine(527)-N(7))-methyltransferase RsmG [uncultured Peptoniphilus sp.]|uniref:16S rRNA (guanine(527)-N(7))-methyltransferase RsmG n=1 Tax=uncultured Peptoniphilus sp. TaxID=254354 RepID=UPI0025887ECA|nr:16S rRNA (guanine(527)-N(7))-methyltransferase RsmG [uncultured Peptoniphilus sp.]MDU6783896.1 16S rRNA (guanine(527)-N(7))-methyltransferase RsmG [Peptoniphilus harei]